MTKPLLLILGKLPPPYMGPSVATQILLQSSLRNNFRLSHVDTKTFGSLSELGRWSVKKIFRNIAIYFELLGKCIFKRPKLVLIPISQTTTGFLKDSVFIAIALITFRKVVLHLRGSDFRRWYDSRGAFLRMYIRLIIRQTNGVIVLGNNLKYLFHGILKERKIFVCPNGGNYSIKKINVNNKKRQILYLANLNRAKGIEDLLLAVKILRERKVEGFEVNVAGDWLSDELKRTCEQLVRESSLPVSFYPPASGETKMKLFGAADIFVFAPRDPEGHPWVIVEAMAAALPIIATDRGAIVESVIDGENGFIVPLNSPAVIAEKLESLITDNALREGMSESSLRFYKEKFTEEKMVSNLKKIFTAVINNKA